MSGYICVFHILFIYETSTNTKLSIAFWHYLSPVSVTPIFRVGREQIIQTFVKKEIILTRWLFSLKML